MKATIDKNGRLTIQAETELEAYALGKWVDQNVRTDCDVPHPDVRIRSANVMFNWGLEERDKQ